MSASYDELIHSIAELESTEFLEELSEHLGKEVERLIEHGFQSATAPDGTVWAPRKLAKGRTSPPHLPLRKSYRMHDSFTVEASAAGVHVTNPVEYTRFQNDGTGYIDARPMVPPEGDLQGWEKPLKEAGLKFLATKLNEGR
jgi:hypothetical protein